MLVTYGAEDDLLALAKLLSKPATSSSGLGMLLGEVIDRGAKTGSHKIAAELEAQARVLRESSTTPNVYEIARLETLARRLRARVPAPPTK